jgi:hypothetical protein
MGGVFTQKFVSHKITRHGYHQVPFLGQGYDNNVLGKITQQHIPLLPLPTSRR